MLDIKILKKSWFFKELNLEKNDVVFDEWEVDENIYIVLAWKLIVEKYLDKDKKEIKKLAILNQFDIFWEWSLNNSNKKEVKISAFSSTTLLSINAKKWINNFSKKYPIEWLNLLKYIIHISNKRLLESNKLITANYKISKEIIWLNEINNKKIFELIEKIKDIINISYILYFEENPVLKNYLKLKYDTRFKGKLQDKIIEVTDSQLDLLSFKVWNIYNYIQKLSIWFNNFWFLVFFKENKDFSDNDKKILISLSISIAWLIKQKQLLDEERDKNYMK